MLGNLKKLKSCISQDWDSCFLNNNLNIKKHGALPVRQPRGGALRRSQLFSFLTYLPPTFPNRESIHPSLYPPRKRRHK